LPLPPSKILDPLPNQQLVTTAFNIRPHPFSKPRRQRPLRNYPPSFRVSARLTRPLMGAPPPSPCPTRHWKTSALFCLLAFFPDVRPVITVRFWTCHTAMINSPPVAETSTKAEFFFSSQEFSFPTSITPVFATPSLLTHLSISLALGIESLSLCLALPAQVNFPLLATHQTKVLCALFQFHGVSPQSFVCTPPSNYFFFTPKAPPKHTLNQSFYLDVFLFKNGAWQFPYFFSRSPKGAFDEGMATFPTSHVFPLDFFLTLGQILAPVVRGIS